MPEQEDNQTATGPQGPYKPFVPESDESERPLAEGTANEPDDSLLQEASSDVGEEIGAPPPEDFKPKRSGKKFGKVLLILILLVGIAGGAYYYFMVYKKAEPAVAPAPQVEAPAANTFTPENVAYAFREKETDPFMLYLRPVTGGDRVEAGELGEDAYPTSDVNGQNIAVIFGDTLQVSRDGGNTYTQVVELEAGQEITSAMFNSDSSKLGVAIFENNKNTVSSVDLDGQNMTELFSDSKNGGITLLGWNDKSVIYDAGCWGCDGSYPNPYHYDLEAKKAKQLVKPTDQLQIWSIAASNDLTKLVYAHGKEDPTPDGLGATPLAPHVVTLLEIESGNATDIATAGKTGEKETNGTDKYRDTKVGFLVNSDIPYYVDGRKLYTGSEPTIAYETKDSIVDVLFVSDSTVIASSGTFSNFTLANFNVETKESVTILEGDDKTDLFGITTK